MKIKSVALVVLLGWHGAVFADALDQLAQALEGISKMKKGKPELPPRPLKTEPGKPAVSPRQLKAEIKYTELINEAFLLAKYSSIQSQIQEALENHSSLIKNIKTEDARKNQENKLDIALQAILKDLNATDKTKLLDLIKSGLEDTFGDLQARKKKLKDLLETGESLKKFFNEFASKDSYRDAWNKLSLQEKNAIVFKDIVNNNFIYNDELAGKFLSAAVDNKNLQAFLDQYFPKAKPKIKKNETQLLQAFKTIDEDFAVALKNNTKTLAYLLSDATFSDAGQSKPIEYLFKENAKLRDNDVLKEFEIDLPQGIKINDLLKGVAKLGATKAIGLAFGDKNWPFSDDDKENDDDND